MRHAPESPTTSCPDLAASAARGWRMAQRLFAVGHDVADAVDYFGLALEHTILVGSEIPL